jgi:hypothetical protein
MSHHRLRRATLGCAVVLATVAATVMITATPAAAATLITCTGTDEAKYHPGLTYSTQTVSFKGEDSATCTSLTDPSLDTVANPYRGTASLSCNNIVLPLPGTETLIWNGNNNLTSTWEFTASFQTINGVLVSTFVGEITDGVLEGATLTKTTAVSASVLDACNQPGGLKNVSGPSAWEFVG